MQHGRFVEEVVYMQKTLSSTFIYTIFIYTIFQEGDIFSSGQSTIWPSEQRIIDGLGLIRLFF